MANKCMLCGKKIGFFAVSGEDIFTGNTANAICKECVEQTDIILKKAEMKIPIKLEDLEKFTDKGKQYITDYLGSEGVFEDEDLFVDPMQCEIGEATISHTFLVDDEECAEILEKLHSMNPKEIEEYLDPLVSENETADGFFREIMALSNAELDSVLEDQREYYNNAEWAYLLYLKECRVRIEEKLGETENIDEAEGSPLIAPNEIDGLKIAEFQEKYADSTIEELQEIANSDEFLYEARVAAQNLLNKM